MLIRGSLFKTSFFYTNLNPEKGHDRHEKEQDDRRNDPDINAL